MDMDNHVLDKEEGCYDNTEAAFSDDEEEVNNKGDDNKTGSIWISLHLISLYTLVYLWQVNSLFTCSLIKTPLHHVVCQPITVQERNESSGSIQSKRR